MMQAKGQAAGYVPAVTPRNIEFSSEYLAGILRDGNRANTFISKGLPEDATLVKVRFDYERAVLVTTWISAHWPEGDYPGATFYMEVTSFFCMNCCDWPQGIEGG